MSDQGGCGKQRYRTELDAKLVLLRVSRKDQDHRQERRIYQCGWCGGAWHLTREEKRARP